VTLSTSLSLVHLGINQHTTLELPSFTDSKDMIGGKILKTGYMTLITHIRGSLLF